MMMLIIMMVENSLEIEPDLDKVDGEVFVHQPPPLLLGQGKELCRGPGIWNH